MGHHHNFADLEVSYLDSGFLSLARWEEAKGRHSKEEFHFTKSKTTQTGAPKVNFHNDAARLLSEMGTPHIQLSISHDEDVVFAVAIIQESGVGRFPSL